MDYNVVYSGWYNSIFPFALPIPCTYFYSTTIMAIALSLPPLSPSYRPTTPPLPPSILSIIVAPSKFLETLVFSLFLSSLAHSTSTFFFVTFFSSYFPSTSFLHIAFLFSSPMLLTSALFPPFHFDMCTLLFFFFPTPMFASSLISFLFSFCTLFPTFFKESC